MRQNQFDRDIFDNIPISVTTKLKVGGKENTAVGSFVETEENGSIKTYKCAVSIDGLVINEESIKYSDFPVIEYHADVVNGSGKTSERVTDFIPFYTVFKGEDAILEYSNGDTCTPDGYEIFKSDLKEPVYMETADGTSCNGAFPYMRLQFKNYGVNIAVGYTGQWCAEFRKENDRVYFYAKQKVFDTVIYPGEKMIAPGMTYMFYDGDAERGTNLWRSFYREHIMPKPGGVPLEPYLVLHQFGEGPECTRAYEELQLRSIDTYIKRGLKPDIWWIDAGWYPCKFDWPHTGTWDENRDNWPNGLDPVGKKCDENGIKFLLWFEPERVSDGSWLETEHPEWLLRSGEPHEEIYSMLNLGDPEAYNWLVEHVDAMIKRCHIKIYRQDFNMNPVRNWRFAETVDRQGAVENKCIQGYYNYWDELLRRNPGILIDSCASGGRRNDIETMRRAVPLHYTDVLYGVHPVKQKQHRLMFEWIPYFRAHNMSWDNAEGTYDPLGNKPRDEFAYLNAMAPAMTDMINADEDDRSFELARTMSAIHKKAASYMLDGDFYPLTECRKDEHDVYAVQFDRGGEGFVEVIYNTKAEGVFTLKLKALDIDRDYSVKNAKTGEEKTYSGKALTEGVDIELQSRSGAVWFYKAK